MPETHYVHINFSVAGIIDEVHCIEKELAEEMKEWTDQSRQEPLFVHCYSCSLVVCFGWLWWFSHSLLSESCIPMDCTPQAPLSMVFARQEYWNGKPFLSLGDLLDPGIKPTSLVSHAVSCIAGRLFTNWATREALTLGSILIFKILTLLIQEHNVSLLFFFYFLFSFFNFFQQCLIVFCIEVFCPFRQVYS